MGSLLTAFQSSLSRIFIILTLLFLSVSCDQISKNIARERLSKNETVQLLNKHLTLVKVENTGAFLSIGTELPQPYKFILLTCLPVIVLLIALGYLLFQSSLSRLSTLGVSLFIGGGIGNLYDRLLYGSVTDFLHLDFVLFETGIFNVADICITTGVLLLLIGMIREAQAPTRLQEL